MRVAFVGLPLAALLLARDGHEIVFAGLCRDGAPGARRLRSEIGRDAVFVRPDLDAPDVRAEIARAKPDVLISWFWTTKISTQVVAIAPLGGFGAHPSLLPRWRGPDPCFWAIDSGDATSGVTVHRIDAGYDTGAIVRQRAIDVDPRWNAWDLARAIDAPSIALLRGVVSELASRGAVDSVVQDEARVTDAPTPKDDLLELDFRRDAQSLLRRIRAAAPYPGAWTFIGDEALIVTHAAVVARPSWLEPGEACVVETQPPGPTAVVATGRGGLALLGGRVVRDDDSEAVVGAREIAGLVCPHPGPS